MKNIIFDFQRHNKDNEWFVLLVPSFIVASFRGTYEMGITWLLWTAVFVIKK